LTLLSRSDLPLAAAFLWAAVLRRNDCQAVVVVFALLSRVPIPTNEQNCYVNCYSQRRLARRIHFLRHSPTWKNTTSFPTSSLHAARGGPATNYSMLRSRSMMMVKVGLLLWHVTN